VAVKCAVKYDFEMTMKKTQNNVVLCMITGMPIMNAFSLLGSLSYLTRYV
jgi:hypothetical protein